MICTRSSNASASPTKMIHRGEGEEAIKRTYVDAGKTHYEARNKGFTHATKKRISIIYIIKRTIEGNNNTDRQRKTRSFACRYVVRDSELFKSKETEKYHRSWNNICFLQNLLRFAVLVSLQLSMQKEVYRSADLLTSSTNALCFPYSQGSMK